MHADFSKSCDVRMKSFGVLRVYRSYGMSNNKALTMILFIEGATFQMGIRAVFPMSLLLWICGTVESGPKSYGSHGQ